MLILDDLKQCGLNKSRPKRFFFANLDLNGLTRQFKVIRLQRGLSHITQNHWQKSYLQKWFLAKKRQKYPDESVYSFTAFT